MSSSEAETDDAVEAWLSRLPTKKYYYDFFISVPIFCIVFHTVNEHIKDALLIPADDLGRLKEGIPARE
jgi:hypothetical protein